MRMMAYIICIIFGSLLGIVIGLVLGVAIAANSTTFNSDIALKLSNMMNSSMLDCVTKQVITKEQANIYKKLYNKIIKHIYKEDE